MDWMILIVVLAVAAVFVPGWGFASRWRQWREARLRRRIEDALKHLLTLSQRGQAGTAESIGGFLRISSDLVVDLLRQMEARRLVHTEMGAIRLTPDGERWAIQIVRAHRLWERYFADEARMPLVEVHTAAERAEHQLRGEDLDALEAHLGHPDLDPHGDPIPRADGSVAEQAGVSLTNWESDIQAHIVHIEDEPTVVFRQIAALGFQVGDALRVLERNPNYLLISHGGFEHRLAPVIAANIQVQAAPVAPSKPADTLTLNQLSNSDVAVVVGIDPHFRGFARRRLLDLGLTPGAQVSPVLENAFGDPRGYRVRGTTVALRAEQAKHVWIRPMGQEIEA